MQVFENWNECKWHTQLNLQLYLLNFSLSFSNPLNPQHLKRIKSYIKEGGKLLNIYHEAQLEMIEYILNNQYHTN